MYFAFLDLRTKNFISFFFLNLHFDFVLSSGQEDSRFWNLLFRAGCSLLVSFPSRSSSFCSPSDLYLVAINFLPTHESSINKTLVPVLFRTGPDEHLVVTCLPTDFLLFRALVPALLQWLSFVLRRGVLCLLTDFVLFRGLVPGLIVRLSFVLCRDFFCLPTDLLLFRALVPGPLQRLCFVFRRGFLCVPIHFILFHAVVPGLLPPSLFCSALRIPLCSRSHSFVLIAPYPLLSTSSKQYHAHEAVWLPFVLLMFLFVFPCPDPDLHTPCHCSSIEDGVLFKGNVVLLGRNEWLFPQYRPGK